ncbi:MAG: TIR domain-containing protein [Acidimicrobiales bacterium]
MARKVFFSFHYVPDSWRASQVRQIGSIEGNAAISDNDWEKVTKAGDQAIKKWIAGQMSGKSCEVVLIGTATAGRKWINYEITEAWKANKGVVGIYVHRLKDANQQQSTKGANPFSGFNINGTSFASIVKAYDPPYSDSKQAYKYIANNIERFVEEAIAIRGKY